MRPAIFVVIALTCATTTSAQNPTPTLSRGDRFFESNAGLSWYSPSAAALGSITGRRVYLTGLRLESVLRTTGPFALASTMELIPIAVVERTNANPRTCYTDRDSSRICEYDRSAEVAVGTGAAPLGLKLHLNRAHPVRFYVAGAAGALVFSSDVPVNGSRRLNFTFEYGTGLEMPMNGRTLSVGYKFHHISNAGFGRLNPGLDSNVLYVGLRRQVTRR
jgi:hypothetical protein